MFLTSWLRQLRRHPPCHVPALRSVRPRLEMLEDRIAPTTFAAADAQTTAAPPSQQQALLSLFIDGAALEATNLTYQFIHGDDFNVDNYYGSPSQLAVVRANAAAAGINYDTVMSLENYLGTIRGYFTIQPDIAANAPYAEPFAELAVLAGGEAVYQAAQLS